MTEITDPEVRILAALAASLETDYVGVGEAWRGSPFAWIKGRPSRQVGKIGEQLVAGWLASRRFNIARCPDSDADMLVEDKRVEVKFSTLWQNGQYTFQQLRDQRYEIAVCLGVSPFTAHCWVLTKEEVLHHWRVAANIASQHGGAAGSDTGWFRVDPVNPPEWLSQHGLTLQGALQLLAALTGFSPSARTDY